MSFFLTALGLAFVVGALRGLWLTGVDPAPRIRVATPPPCVRPAARERRRRAA